MANKKFGRDELLLVRLFEIERQTDERELIPTGLRVTCMRLKPELFAESDFITLEYVPASAILAPILHGWLQLGAALVGAYIICFLCIRPLLTGVQKWASLPAKALSDTMELVERIGVWA